LLRDLLCLPLTLWRGDLSPMDCEAVLAFALKEGRFATYRG